MTPNGELLILLIYLERPKIDEMQAEMQVLSVTSRPVPLTGFGPEDQHIDFLSSLALSPGESLGKTDSSATLSLSKMG